MADCKDFVIVPRESYIAAMLRRGDLDEIEKICKSYGIKRPDLVRSFVTSLLKMIDQEKSIPIVPVEENEIITLKVLTRFNFGPTVGQLKRLKEVSHDLGIAVAHLIVIAVRIGIAKYREGTFRLEKVYNATDAR